MVITALIKALVYPESERIQFIPRHIDTTKDGEENPGIRFFEVSAASWIQIVAGLKEYGFKDYALARSSTAIQSYRADGEQLFFSLSELDRKDAKQYKPKVISEGDELSRVEQVIINALIDNSGNVAGTARGLGMAQSSVRSHLASLSKKWGVFSISEVVQKAQKLRASVLALSSGNSAGQADGVRALDGQS